MGRLAPATSVPNGSRAIDCRGVAASLWSELRPRSPVPKRLPTSPLGSAPVIRGAGNLDANTTRLCSAYRRWWGSEAPWRGRA